MDRLAETAEEASALLREKESKREYTLKRSREIIRETKRMIHAIHVSDDPDSSGAVLQKLASELVSCIGNDPLMAGTAEDALGEYAEAMILDSVIKGQGVPSFGDLGIGPGPWVLGLADCPGEIRRVVLTSLMNGDPSAAVSMFSEMERIFHVLMAFDVPDAILPIRRKQDIARGVMERTRTDITNAVMLLKSRD